MNQARSKTVATWLAIVGGLLGLHRFYLHGLRDVWGWLHWPVTLMGLYGVHRLKQLGHDDALSWLLLPLLGLMIAQAMLAAIVLALTPDDRWNLRFPSLNTNARTAWGPVLGAVLALLIGGTALTSTIAFAGQRYFEWVSIKT